MKITADTNLLIRALVGDDVRQAEAAHIALADAELIALTLPTLCEVVWVLGRGYKYSAPKIAGAISTLLATANVAVDRPAAEAGLRALQAGGDFADGVIAFEGHRLGADTFVTFDQKAAMLLERQGWSVRLLALSA